jgi:TRAP-type C4-dicarboxylate transport system permease small subunit
MEDDVATFQGLENVFSRVISIVIGLAGLAFFIMLVLGGFKYMTAGGDPKAVESAKNTLTYAIAGLVLIALSYLILVFIEQFTGVNVTEFKIAQ